MCTHSSIKDATLILRRNVDFGGSNDSMRNHWANLERVAKGGRRRCDESLQGPDFFHLRGSLDSWPAYDFDGVKKSQGQVEASEKRRDHQLCT